MPKVNNTEELRAEALKRKQERDRIAQATWVAKNKEVHLERMRLQYQRKKAEKIARGEVTVKPAPVVVVQPPNQLKNGTIDNSTLADAIKKIKDDYIRVRLYKVYGENPTAEEKKDFMLKLVLPADLVVKNKSKLTPAHLTQIEKLGKDLRTILHHDFAPKKTRKLRVAYVPKPKAKRISIADQIADTDDEDYE
jgi:hypothetical protein